MTAAPNEFDPAVLLVDDDPTALRSTSLLLRGSGIREVLTTSDGREVARLMLERSVGVVVVDLSMPLMSGHELLAEITANHPGTPVLVLTGVSSLDTAVECMKGGAIDYLVKPVERERLVSAVRRALEVRALRAEVASLKDAIVTGPGAGQEAFAGVLTQSPSMLAVFALLRVFARSPQPILLTGEDGTGRELIARAIHALSGRSGPFIAVDAAGLDDAAFSGLLFGQAPAAPVAAGVCEGLVQTAAAGTLFIGEIGTLAGASQARLARLLRDGSYLQQGSDAPHRTSAAIVATTTLDARAAAEQGSFRRDLYDRLRGHHVHVPPLRERLGDLPLLVGHFVEQEAQALGRRTPQIPLALFQLLRTYRFPGNVGELAGMCREAVARNRTRTLALDSFRDYIAGRPPPIAAQSDSTSSAGWPPAQLPTLSEAKSALVAEALRRAEGNQGIAASLLGVKRQALNRYVVNKMRRSTTRAAAADPLSLGAVAAVAALRGGEISVERYMRALVDHCERFRELNAFIGFEPERALAAARALDRGRSRTPPGALWGLPVVIKDNIDVAGLPTTAGTPALRSNVARATAPVAAALFEAGALLLGKANMHELAEGITNNNAAFGAVHNPYAPAMIPGGSSGGTAAAVAARLCPAGLGTDTGGSVRIPAALCGVVGFRPSAGRYPGAGIVPISHTRDTAGPIGRSVADVALLDAVVTHAPTLVAARTLTGVRIGVPTAPFFEDLDADVAAVIEGALARLRAAGCVLVRADMPGLAALSAPAAGPIAYYEQSRDLDAYLRAAGTGLTTVDVARQIASPDVRAIYEKDVLGTGAVTEEAYREAMTVHRPRLQSFYRNHFAAQQVAAIVLPTTVVAARPIGEDAEIELNGRRVPTFATYLRNTRTMTTAGLPGLSIPAGLTTAGLPVGLELDGPEGSDRELLAIGLAVEAALGPLPPPALLGGS